jgi:repressor LexA
MENSIDITDLVTMISDLPRDADNSGVEEPDFAFREDDGELVSIAAGWPGELAEGCVRLDPAAVLRATPRSFALRVRGQSMVNAGIYDGDIVVGEITPVARDGAIVVALIDGESTLKRLVLERGRPYLISENPACPAFMPLGELVVQGVVHTVVRRTL